MMHFMVLFLALWTLLHVYVFRRAATVPVIARNVPRLVLLGLAALLWSSVLLGRLLDRLGLAGGGRLLETVGWNWIAVLFLAVVALDVAQHPAARAPGSILRPAGALFQRLRRGKYLAPAEVPRSGNRRQAPGLPVR